MHNSGASRRGNDEPYLAMSIVGCLKFESTIVVPATRLRQGFAGVMTVGRRSFSEGVTQGPITTGSRVARKSLNSVFQNERPRRMGRGACHRAGNSRTRWFAGTTSERLALAM